MFASLNYRTSTVNGILDVISKLTVGYEEKEEDKTTEKIDLSPCVRIKGLEPPRLSASDPKSDVATNYTISA